MNVNRIGILPLIVFLFTFLLPFKGEAQKFSDTAKKIESIFPQLNHSTPGAALCISRGEKILFAKGFGMSDLEHNMPVSALTIFEAGSVSKQFTATSILLLVQKKKITLDDVVQTYIPELPYYPWPITIRQLMNHTSGIRDWGVVAEIGGWPRGSRVYTNDLALKYIIKQEQLNNIPGEEYLYSNSNYTLLTIIVERVSGKTLPEFTEEYIFKPLGMQNTQWRNNFKSVVKDRAIGYDLIKDSYLSNMPFENTYGHAALLTNVKDLDIWNKSWKNSPLGGNDLLALRTEVGFLNNGEKISYAAGVMVGDYKYHTEISHSGATAGYRCWLAYYPDDDLSIVYLSNATYIPTVQTGKKIAEIFFGEEPPRANDSLKEIDSEYIPNVEDLKSSEGTYVSKECDGQYNIRFEKNHLSLDDCINKKVLLIPIGKNKFKARGKTYFFKQFGPNKQLFVTASRARNVKFISK